MKTLHLMQRMSQREATKTFNSLYLFYALAPKQSLNFILHTALLGTITSIMSIIVTIYLCQHFEHSLLLIVIKNDYTYMTIWFVTSIYLQVFSFIQRLVVVKKVLQILNDSGQEVDDANRGFKRVLRWKKKRVDGFILLQNQQDDGESEIFGELLQLFVFSSSCDSLQFYGEPYG